MGPGRPTKPKEFRWRGPKPSPMSTAPMLNISIKCKKPCLRPKSNGRSWVLRSEHWSWLSEAVNTLFPWFIHLTTAHRGVKKACGTYRAALQCASSSDVLGLQISGKSCRSICGKKRFDKTMAASQFELQWMRCPNGTINIWYYWQCFSVTTFQ